MRVGTAARVGRVHRWVATLRGAGRRILGDLALRLRVLRDAARDGTARDLAARGVRRALLHGALAVLRQLVVTRARVRDAGRALDERAVIRRAGAVAVGGDLIARVDDRLLVPGVVAALRVDTLGRTNEEHNREKTLPP